MTRLDPARSSVSSRSWIRTAAVGLASLAFVANAPFVNAAGDPAHFRGREGPVNAMLAQAQAQAQSHVYQALLHQRETGGRRLDTNATVNNAVDKANEVGASVRKAIKQLRGGTDKFYQDLITAVKIQLCDQNVGKADVTKDPKNRFVDASSDLAYKDSNGDCVKVQVTALTDDTVKNEYSQGHCEVKPNCYWTEIGATDTERRPVWAITEAAQPEDGAMTLADSKEVLMKWAQGLMIFVVPGIILGVLSLLTMIFFLLCRCCCNRCGGRSPKEGGYTCMQKFWPLFFYLLFAIGVIVVAGVSLLYQKTVTSAVSDTFQAASDTLGDATKWIGDIEAPLINIRDKVTSSANDVKVELDGTDFIDRGISDLTGNLTLFGSYSAGRTLPEGCVIDASEPYCLACQVCTTISTEVNTANTQITDNAGQGVALFKSVKKDLNSLLVDTASSVKTTVDDQVDMLNTLSSTITDAQKQVDDIQDQYEKQKAAQQAGVLALFGLALGVIAIGFVGILFGLTPLKFLANIIHIAYVIGFIALFLTFIISAIFLAISVVLGDVCEVTSIFTADWTVPLGDAAKGVNACFQNESLIDTFNLSSSLEFARGGIKFPNNDLTKMLDFSSLDTFATTINGTTASTFNYSASDATTALGHLNDLTKQTTGGVCQPSDTYTLTDVYVPWTANGASRQGLETPEEFITRRYNTTAYNTNCDRTAAGGDSNAHVFACSRGTCSYGDAVLELFHAAKMLALVDRDIGSFITGLHSNITIVTDVTADFKDNTRAFDTKISKIRTDLESSLIKYVGDFEKAMYCTFISDGFFEIYEALCGKLMPAFTMISLMLFLAGVFLFPVNVCLIIACKRLKARGNGGHVMDNEMKFK